MPNSAKTHFEMQASVCFLCFRKPKHLRNITPRLESMLESVMTIPFTSKEWSWLPTKICGGCCSELERVKRNPKHPLKMIDFLSLTHPQTQHSMDTRSRLQSQETTKAPQCLCSLCCIGRLNGGAYNHYKVTVSDPPGRPNIEEKPVALQVCSFCNSKLGPGMKHQCNRTAKRSNLEDLVRSSSSKSRERVLSSQLKEVFVVQGVSTKGGTVSLSTGGAPIQATLGKIKQKPDIKFSNETLKRLQISLGASDRKMNIVGNFLRAECGRGSVMKLQHNMVERNKKLSRHFEGKMLEQKELITDPSDDKENVKDPKKKKKILVEVKKPAVIVKSVEDFASQVMMERNISPEESEIQIGIDDGQNLLKIMMTVKEKEKSEEIKKKKFDYSEGFRPKEFKLSGVKKIMILFASRTCERYDNLATILGELDLQAVEFGFSCDLKLVLILCGKQCASSKHCCPFCSGSAPWLAKKNNNTIGSLWSN